MRAMPQYEEMKRRAKKKEREAAKAREAEETVAKRPKIDTPDEDPSDDDDMTDDPIVKPKAPLAESAVDITEKFVQSRLGDPRFATELVLVSMSMLPSVMPPHFNNTYTPIAAAGTEGQVRHVSRLLATQLTSAGLGPGVRMVEERRLSTVEPDEEDEESAARISTVVGMTTDRDADTRDKPAVKLTPAGLTGRKGRSGKTLKLSEITRPLSDGAKKTMILNAVQRILKAEKAAVVGGIPGVRNKIIATLASTFSADIKGILLDFIFSDLNTRADLAFSWLFEEYCFYTGFNRKA